MFSISICAIWIETSRFEGFIVEHTLIIEARLHGTFFFWQTRNWYFSSTTGKTEGNVEVVIFLDFLVLVMIVYLTYFMYIYIYCKYINASRQITHLLRFCHNIFKKAFQVWSQKFLHQTFFVFLSNNWSTGRLEPQRVMCLIIGVKVSCAIREALGPCTNAFLPTILILKGACLIEIHELHELLRIPAPKCVEQRVFSPEKWMVWRRSFYFVLGFANFQGLTVQLREGIHPFRWSIDRAPNWGWTILVPGPWGKTLCQTSQTGTFFWCCKRCWCWRGFSLGVIVIDSF